MNILVLCCNLEAGGGQIFALRLASALRKYHKVYFGVVSYKGDPTEVRIEDYKVDFLKEFSFDPTPLIPIHSFLDRILKKFSGLLHTLRIHSAFRSYILGKYFHHRKHRLSYYLSKYKIDLINTHLFCAEEYAVGNQLLTQKLPVVVSMHGCYESLPNLVPDFNKRATSVLKQVNAIAYVADKNLSFLNQFESEISRNIITEKIYYGYEPQITTTKSLDALGIPKNSFVFGMVARGIAEKGWQQAIEAFLMLQTMITQEKIYLILVGEGVELQELKNVYRKHSCIYFVGFAKNSLEWIPTFQVGLLPTYFAGESLPNTIIEYLYCGKPVITTRAGEIPQMLEWEDASAGFLVDYNEEGKAKVDQMAHCMYKYVTDEKLLTNHSRWAKEAFRKFDMETCIQKYTTLFEKARLQN